MEGNQSLITCIRCKKDLPASYRFCVKCGFAVKPWLAQEQPSKAIEALLSKSSSAMKTLPPIRTKYAIYDKKSRLKKKKRSKKESMTEKKINSKSTFTLPYDDRIEKLRNRYLLQSKSLYDQFQSDFYRSLELEQVNAMSIESLPPLRSASAPSSASDQKVSASGQTIPSIDQLYRRLHSHEVIYTSYTDQHRLLEQPVRVISADKLRQDNLTPLPPLPDQEGSVVSKGGLWRSMSSYSTLGNNGRQGPEEEEEEGKVKERDGGEREHSREGEREEESVVAYSNNYTINDDQSHVFQLEEDSLATSPSPPSPPLPSSPYPAHSNNDNANGVRETPSMVYNQFLSNVNKMREHYLLPSAPLLSPSVPSTPLSSTPLSSSPPPTLPPYPSSSTLPTIREERGEEEEKERRKEEMHFDESPWREEEAVKREEEYGEDREYSQVYSLSLSLLEDIKSSVERDRKRVLEEIEDLFSPRSPAGGGEREEEKTLLSSSPSLSSTTLSLLPLLSPRDAALLDRKDTHIFRDNALVTYFTRYYEEREREQRRVSLSRYTSLEEEEEVLMVSPFVLLPQYQTEREKEGEGAGREEGEFEREEWEKGEDEAEEWEEESRDEEGREEEEEEVQTERLDLVTHRMLRQLDERDRRVRRRHRMAHSVGEGEDGGAEGGVEGSGVWGGRGKVQREGAGESSDEDEDWLFQLLEKEERGKKGGVLKRGGGGESFPGEWKGVSEQVKHAQENMIAYSDPSRNRDGGGGNSALVRRLSSHTNYIHSPNKNNNTSRNELVSDNSKGEDANEETGDNNLLVQTVENESKLELIQFDKHEESDVQPIEEDIDSSIKVSNLFISTYQAMKQAVQILETIDIRIPSSQLPLPTLTTLHSTYSNALELLEAIDMNLENEIKHTIMSFFAKARFVRSQLAIRITQQMTKASVLEVFFTHQLQDEGMSLSGLQSLSSIGEMSSIKKHERYSEEQLEIIATAQEALGKCGEKMDALHLEEAEMLKKLKGEEKGLLNGIKEWRDKHLQMKIRLKIAVQRAQKYLAISYDN